MSLLEFGGSAGKLLVVGVSERPDPTGPELDHYRNLAQRVERQIDLGRASADVTSSTARLISTSLAYGAIIDPEPLSKAVAALGAWGAKKAGDAVSDVVLRHSEAEVKAILAEGLKHSGLSPAELKAMSPSEFRAKVADLKVGGQTLREMLKDQPKALAHLQAHATDIATDIGVEALSLAKGTAAEVEEIKTTITASLGRIEQYQREVDRRLTVVQGGLSNLSTAVQESRDRLNDLTKEVKGNSQAIQTLSEISYSGWNTTQKLEAVRRGMFPGLSDGQQRALEKSLEADQRREKITTDLQNAASDFGSLAAIAGNIGLPPNIVTGLKAAQTVATGIAQFASGNYLAAAASVTSLMGIGAPDAAAERHAAMMSFLQEQFEAVHKKLDVIIDLQQRTLKALGALAEQQAEFRREVLGQLDRVEDTVLRNERMLQAVLLTRWSECRSFVNVPALNGVYQTVTRDTLLALVRDRNAESYAGPCYAVLTGFLDAHVKPASWAGQIISAGEFPSDAIPMNADVQRAWTETQKSRRITHEATQQFIIVALAAKKIAPATAMARLAWPAVSASASEELDRMVGLKGDQDPFKDFHCSTAGRLATGLQELLCFRTVPGKAMSPTAGRLDEILSAPLIGPHALTLIDTGLMLSTVADFAQRKGNDTFQFVPATAIERAAETTNAQALRLALHEGKGQDLLTKLQWLSEAMLLQQSVMYGDYTAVLVVDTLYDPATKALNLTDDSVPAKKAAIRLMRANPVVARNAVMLAMRRAIEESLGGKTVAEGTRYRQTHYNAALRDFSVGESCDPAAIVPRTKLAELLPNWKFEYRVLPADKKGAFSRCQEASAAPAEEGSGDRGAGVAVSFPGGFYVTLPTPMKLTHGTFERTDALQRALAYRDRLSQHVIDRNVGSTLAAYAKEQGLSEADHARLARGLLNEAWDWQPRAAGQK